MGLISYISRKTFQPREYKKTGGDDISDDLTALGRGNISEGYMIEDINGMVEVKKSYVMSRPDWYIFNRVIRRGGRIYNVYKMVFGQTPLP